MSPQELLAGDPTLMVQFLAAVAVALAAMVPIGAVSILTIQRAMSLGFWRAYWPTLGATAGNGIFGVIAALGSGYLSASITGSRIWLRLIASLILVVVGLRLSTSQGKDPSQTEGGFGLVRLGFLKMVLVLTNPLTLGFYIAAFAALGLASPRLLAWRSVALGGGIALGTVVWFLFVCTSASRFHLRLDKTLLRRIRAGVGVLLIILGVVSAASVLF